MRYIWIIRHGKSAAAEPGQNDHDRALNGRGLRDGETMRNWYAARKHPAQWVWSSSAVRAKLTAEYVASGFSATLVEVPGLYLATADNVLSCLRSTPEDISSVAVVAHNPGLTYLVNQLVSRPVTDNLVTFATALVATKRSWADLSFGSGELLSLQSPKTI